MLSRRAFLRRNLGAGSLFALHATVPGFLACTARAADGETAERILVVVELTGGNDGLNTVIPYGDDLYHKARPTLRYEKQAVLPIDDHIGLHPSLNPLKELYDEGQLAIVQGVGYPNPNRSHFESMDIWQSADPRRRSGNGWLGRALGSVRVREGRMPAMHVSGQQLPLALKGAPSDVPTIHPNRPLELVLSGDGAEPTDDYDSSGGAVVSSEQQGERDTERRKLVRDLAGAAGRDEGSMLQFVRRMSLDTYTTLDRLREILASDFEPPDAEGEFEGGRFRFVREGLGYELGLVAKLIQADFGSRVFYVAFDGFDTHGEQRATHAELLTTVAESIKAFFDVLKESGDDKRVALMTYSEFGRRLEENASQGTDHGTASNLFVAGPAVKGGLVGKHPSLAASDLDGDDPKFLIDFRRVYATLLDRWLGCDSKTVLGERYDELPLVS